jgi:hypothetical protein
MAENPNKLAFEQAIERSGLTPEEFAQRLNAYEPPPKKNDGPRVWDLVIADMRERDLIGTAKYGTPLQPFNGRDALVDAYQEALDLAVYLRQAIEERKAPPNLVMLAREAHQATLRHTCPQCNWDPMRESYHHCVWIAAVKAVIQALPEVPRG